jgi:CarD family transcriptional regulator
MYEKGDKIIYGGSGVCTVVEICTPNFSRAEWGKKYYKLCPVYGTETIYAPVDTKAFMRPVMTRAEADDLISRIPEIDECVCNSHSITMLRQQYEEFFRDHNCETYIGLVKGIYSKGAAGKKLGQTDQRYMKRAEETLYGELAVALDLTPAEVPAYIKSKIEGE